MRAPPTGPRRTPTRHGSLSAPFVAAPPHACSGRGAQGRRHEHVGGCASGAVGRKHTAPLAGRVQQQTIKEGRVEKRKSTVTAPKRQKKEDMGSEIKSRQKLITEKFFKGHTLAHTRNTQKKIMNYKQKAKRKIILKEKLVLGSNSVQGGRKCPTRQPVTPHAAANPHSPNSRSSSDGSILLSLRVPASVLFPCDTFPRLLLRAAAFTSPNCVLTSSFCPSVPSAVSPSAPELTLTSAVTVVPSCLSPSVVAVF
ncbi:hypothetical protein TCSYLVIO_006609, partial [Trypanosoma cruzi]